MSRANEFFDWDGAKARVKRVRKMKTKLEESNTGDDLEARAENANEVGEFIGEELGQVKTTSEMNEILKMLTMHTKATGELLQQLLNDHDPMSVAEVVCTINRDPKRAMEAVMKIKGLMMHMTPLSNSNCSALTCVPTGDIGGRPKKERQKAQREKRVNVKAVEVEKVGEQVQGHKDPTAYAVKKMHGILAKEKTADFFRFLFETDNFQLTALNLHHFSLLLDRRLARLVHKDRKFTITFIPTPKEVAATNGQFTQLTNLLNQDEIHGQSWVVKLDTALLDRLAQQETRGRLALPSCHDKENQSQSDDLDDSGVSSHPSGVPASKKPRI
jgi:hypothetical protein